MEVRYHAFLDESGQREYGEATDPFYVVAGVVVPADKVVSLETEIGGLKRAFFRTRRVEIKSNWLRYPAERKKHYLQAFGLGEAKLRLFVDTLYDWVLAAPVAFIAAVVDKPLMLQKYPNPHHPSALGYLLFAQRYQKFLAQRHSLGAVTCDTVSGASLAGNQWQKLLHAQHLHLKKHGCPYTGSAFPNLADSLFFDDSSHSSLIQLADLIAYNTFRQFKDHGVEWDDPASESLELYSYFARVLPRFRKSQTGVFAGFGVAKMPTRHFHEWVCPEAIEEGAGS